MNEAQQERSEDAIAASLHAILDDARAAELVSNIERAVASMNAPGRVPCDVSERAVACAMAAKTASDALAYYIARGEWFGGGCEEPEAEPLHEACRLAIRAVQIKCRSTILAGRIRETR